MSKTIVKRLLTYRQGLAVERLHTRPHIQPYNNGYHSANAALIALELCMANKMELSVPTCLKHMLQHDIAEGKLGDPPAPVKRLDALRKGYYILENEFERTLLPWFPDLHPQEKDICFIADKAELGFYCMDEKAMGNTLLNPTLINVIKYINEKKTEYNGVEEMLEYFHGGI